MLEPVFILFNFYLSLDIFITRIILIVDFFFCRHVAFFAGSMLAVLIILTVVDEDFLAVSHVIGSMTVLGIIVTLCRACIPDEVNFHCLYTTSLRRYVELSLEVNK